MLIVFILGAYFLPLIVATGRRVPNLGSVAVVNIFLGWTFIGWIVALAMACRSVPPTHQVNVYAQASHPQLYGPPVSAPAERATTSPPGWYADPIGVARLRYFDGSKWTEHIS